MARTKQDRKEEWERERVQRVLDYHNDKHGTQIKIKDKTTKVYPHLEGQLNWDWVCYDTKTGEEIAIEVKRITEQKLEEKAEVVYNLLHEVRNSLSSQFAGDFLLSVNIDDDYDFPFKNQPKNKQVFKDILSKAIIEAAQRLNVGETTDLQPKIGKRLPFELPNIMFFDLHRLNNEGNVLVLNPMIAGSYSIGFDKLELERFKHLVSYANMQLKVAHTDNTVLILIEEGYRPINPPEITEAFTKINSESYSEIKCVYFVRGNEVTEIPLPTP